MQLLQNMSHHVGKPTICIGENKGADQLRISFAVTAKLISAFVFATRIVEFLLYLYPKFQASSSFLCLYRPVCVGHVRKPHCWFSHEEAHILSMDSVTAGCNENTKDTEDAVSIIAECIAYDVHKVNVFSRFLHFLKYQTVFHDQYL